MEPFFSICIPTYKRADLLDYCLTNLEPLEQFPWPFEIIISDNASPDHTQDVIAVHQARKPYIYACRQEEAVSVVANCLTTVRQARGQYFFYLADDDGIFLENLYTHLHRLESEPDLVSLYADWVAYNDAAGQEIHRYFNLAQSVSFSPADPLGLINFVLAHQIYPEIGIYRRQAFLQSYCFVRNGFGPHLWMYRLSRLGRITFEPLPFYREHRLLKPEFRRDNWASMDIQHNMIGDELRNTLETIVLWAFQDMGESQPPVDQIFNVKKAIDRYLHNRTPLNIKRACSNKNWLLALELRRRLILWYGPGTVQQQQQDALDITMPCTCQAIYETYVCLGKVSGLLFHGFLSEQLPNFFRTHYPEVPILTTSVNDLLPEGERQPLIVLRHAAQDRSSFPQWLWPGYQLAFDQLLDNYRVNGIGIDLSQL